MNSNSVEIDEPLNRCNVGIRVMPRLGQYLQLGIIFIGMCFCSELFAWQQTYKEGLDGLPVPLKWKTSGYYYSIYYNGSDDVLLSDMENAIDAAFQTWEQVPCSYFYFEKTDYATVDEVGFNQDRGNVNLLIWRENFDSWPHSPEQIAMTTTSYDQETGEILDVDIELNGADWTFGVLGDPVLEFDRVDIQSVLTHEIGHSLGLEHSNDISSTMYESTSAGDLSHREISEDDANGICTLYSIDDSVSLDFPEPICGLDLEGASHSCENADDGKPNSCSVVVVGHFHSNIFGLLAKLFFR